MDATQEFSEREIKLMRKAAELGAEAAIDKVAERFYKQVGKGVVHRLLVWLGAIVVAYLAGKGWLNLGGPQ